MCAEGTSQELSTAWGRWLGVVWAVGTPWLSRSPGITWELGPARPGLQSVQEMPEIQTLVESPNF